MARTTLDFSSTFQRPHPTAIIMPSPSLPFSLIVHNHHHHYPLKAPTPYSFITNIIIPQPFAPDAADDDHHLHHHKHHTAQAPEEDDEHNQGRSKVAAAAASLMRMRKTLILWYLALDLCGPPTISAESDLAVSNFSYIVIQ
ncbi:hypothetical protein JHK82_011683 [Glycine max]|nr:hypothetical protein JHK85_012001 [Glycine max]KAG5153714.1 hypothetical protein JHK82_011683 [Glycine max]